MIKVLIILALTIYVISKIGSFFFRAGVSSSQQTRYQPPTKPDQPTQKKRRSGAIKGGEYVDYEEIK